MAYFITAIKLGPGGEEEHITTCSLLRPSDGKTFPRSPAAVVKVIEDQHEDVWVGSPNGRVKVVPVHPSGKPAYVRTEANGVRTDNLLRLPRIP